MGAWDSSPKSFPKTTTGAQVWLKPFSKAAWLDAVLADFQAKMAQGAFAIEESAPPGVNLVKMKYAYVNKLAASGYQGVDARLPLSGARPVRPGPSDRIRAVPPTRVTVAFELHLS